jgi:hypothetical protein
MCVNWLLPAIVNLSATPKPYFLLAHPVTPGLASHVGLTLTLMAMTETLPAKEQMVRYTRGVLVPWVGTTR